MDFYTPSLQAEVTPELQPPRELAKVSLPIYRIDPPDLLSIEVLKLVPRPTYRIEPYDVLQIRVLGTIPDQPIDSFFLVEGEGIVNLGPAYGAVRVAGMTIDEATGEITRLLSTVLQQPDVSIQLARAAGVQQIDGVHVVGPDGTVNLLQYGMVRVAGLTVVEARLAVERQLAQYFDSPLIALDIAGYNSKSYYVVIATAELGEGIRRLPITGNETVLDAISYIQGLSQVSSKMMWVARCAPNAPGEEQILPVDWTAIAHGGATDTNYQLLPGDRIYIVDDNLIAANNYIDKIAAPIERLLRLARLGAITTRSTQTLGRDYNRYRSH